MLFYVSDPEGGVVALRLSLAAEFHRADVPGDQVWRGISRALSEHCHIVHRGNFRSQFAAELELEWAFRELRCDDPVLRQLQRMDCGRWPEDLPEGSSLVWLQWLEPYRPVGRMHCCLSRDARQSARALSEIIRGSQGPPKASCLLP
jgi:hypothetical protein